MFPSLKNKLKPFFLVLGMEPRARAYYACALRGSPLQGLPRSNSGPKSSSADHCSAPQRSSAAPTESAHSSVHPAHGDPTDPTCSTQGPSTEVRAQLMSATAHWGLLVSPTGCHLLFLRPCILTPCRGSPVTHSKDEQSGVQARENGQLGGGGAG